MTFMLGGNGIPLTLGLVATNGVATNTEVRSEMVSIMEICLVRVCGCSVDVDAFLI